MTILIVGLGNPGRQYALTRHNVGFMAVDLLAKNFGVTFKNKLFLPVETAEVRYGEHRVILAKPTSYMNRSGDGVKALAKKLGVASPNVFIIHDDVALPLGIIRTRSGGSAGGHNGIKSVIERLGTEEFFRFRVGVSLPAAGQKLEDYVLQPFLLQEKTLLPNILQKTIDLILEALKFGPKDATEKV